MNKLREREVYTGEVCLSYASLGATKLRRHLSAQMGSKNVKNNAEEKKTRAVTD